MMKGFKINFRKSLNFNILSSFIEKKRQLNINEKEFFQFIIFTTFLKKKMNNNNKSRIETSRKNQVN